MAARAEIAREGIAQRLLSERGLDGTIPHHPYSKWRGAHWVLAALADLGYPPGDPSLIPLRDQVYDWLFDEKRLAGIPTINCRTRRCASQEGNALYATLALALEDERTPRLTEWLVGWQWPDGGWNCDKRLEARKSSFQETVIPARGLWAYGTRHGYEPALRAADRAAELLLSRRLLWRRRDGQLVSPDWAGHPDRIHFPIQFYDVLFALQVMAEMGRLGDPRCADALDLLESKRLSDGGFPVEIRNAETAARVTARGTYADWGPGGRTRANPLVSLAALGVMRAAQEAGRES